MKLKNGYTTISGPDQDGSMKVDGVKYVKVQIPIEKIEGHCGGCIANEFESPHGLCGKLYRVDQCEGYIWKEAPSACKNRRMLRDWQPRTT